MNLMKEAANQKLKADDQEKLRILEKASRIYQRLCESREEIIASLIEEGSCKVYVGDFTGKSVYWNMDLHYLPSEIALSKFMFDNEIENDLWIRQEFWYNTGVFCFDNVIISLTKSSRYYKNHKAGTFKKSVNKREIDFDEANTITKEELDVYQSDGSRELRSQREFEEFLASGLSLADYQEKKLDELYGR